MQYKYEEKDIKILKKEKYASYAFILLICGVLIIGITLVIILKPPYCQYWVAGLIVLFSVIFYLIYFFMNRKVLLDIKQQTFEVNSTRIIDMIIKTDYEAGSGSMIKKMRSFQKYLLYFENGNPINVDKELYSKLKTGDSVDILYAKNSKTFLRIEKARSR